MARLGHTRSTGRRFNCSATGNEEQLSVRSRDGRSPADVGDGLVSVCRCTWPNCPARRSRGGGQAEFLRREGRHQARRCGAILGPSRGTASESGRGARRVGSPFELDERRNGASSTRRGEASRHARQHELLGPRSTRRLGDHGEAEPGRAAALQFSARQGADAAKQIDKGLAGWRELATQAGTQRLRSWPHRCSSGSVTRSPTLAVGTRRTRIPGVHRGGQEAW